MALVRVSRPALTWGRTATVASRTRGLAERRGNGSVEPVAARRSGAEGALSTTFAEKAKENVKTAWYGSVILVGVGVTGAIVYLIGQELFGDSPTRLFQEASTRCISDPRVQDLLGEPIKAFGEETRRGRRRHVSHLDYVDEKGHPGVRVQFYLQGVRKRGTAQVDARDDGSGHLKTRFIIVTADDLLRTSVIVEDNRAALSQANSRFP